MFFNLSSFLKDGFIKVKRTSHPKKTILKISIILLIGCVLSMLTVDFVTKLARACKPSNDRTLPVWPASVVKLIYGSKNTPQKLHLWGLGIFLISPLLYQFSHSLYHLKRNDKSKFSKEEDTLLFPLSLTLGFCLICIFMSIKRGLWVIAIWRISLL